MIGGGAPVRKTEYSFSTDGSTLADFVRRTTEAHITLHLVKGLVRAGKVTLTDTQVFIDPERVDEIINQLRGEVELIAESLGHMLDRTV